MTSVHGDEVSETTDLHQIGDVAERTGLSLRTIRWYDEVGVVVPSGRSPGGFRLYTDADIDRLEAVKAFKPLDFTLEETREIMELRDRVARGEVLSPDEAGRLALYADVARSRCHVLREHVRRGEQLADLLQQHADLARRTDAPDG